MTPEPLNEREFELINIIGPKLGSNQRALSHQMDLSLGMVNMLIRRMIAKGYIRIQQLNKRKVEYILTPKGFAEKMRKSVKYTLKTIDSISRINNRLKDFLTELVKNGERSFVIVGSSDFSILVERMIREIDGHCTVTHVENIPQAMTQGTLLICREEVVIQASLPVKAFNLIQELAKDYVHPIGERN